MGQFYFLSHGGKIWYPHESSLPSLGGVGVFSNPPRTNTKITISDNTPVFDSYIEEMGQFFFPVSWWGLVGKIWYLYEPSPPSLGGGKPPLITKPK